MHYIVCVVLVGPAANWGSAPGEDSRGLHDLAEDRPPSRSHSHHHPPLNRPCPPFAEDRFPSVCDLTSSLFSRRSDRRARAPARAGRHPQGGLLLGHRGRPGRGRHHGVRHAQHRPRHHRPQLVRHGPEGTANCVSGYSLQLAVLAVTLRS